MTPCPSCGAMLAAPLVTRILDKSDTEAVCPKDA